MEILISVWIFGVICTGILGFAVLRHLTTYLNDQHKTGKISQQNKVSFSAACVYIALLLTLLWPITVVVFLTAGLFWEEPQKQPK